MNSHIYLDESGDLGFKFDKKYRYGGSSRFLTLGYLICPIGECNIPKRLVRDVYRKFGFNPQNEVKASTLNNTQRKFIAVETVKMLIKRPHFQLGAITVFKERTKSSMRLDPNILYNWMMRQSLLSKVDKDLSCKITRDSRSIKVASGNSCIDYLKTTLIFDHQSDTKLTDNPQHSHNDEGLIFVDWIVNSVWSHYEDNYSEPFNILLPHLKNQKLFF